MKTENRKSVFEKIVNYGFRNVLKQIEPYLGLLLVIVVFQIASNGMLLTERNIKLLVTQSFIMMIGAMGTSFVVAQGNLDFSLGGIIGVSATVGAIAANTMGVVPALFAAIIIGAVIGGVIGLLHVIFRTPAFISTICMMFALRGLTWVLNDNGSIMMSVSTASINTFISRVIMVAVVFIIVFVLFQYTKIGKYSKAIGSNPVAARQSGVPVEKMKVIAYFLSGLFGGICGFLSLARAGSSSTSSGVMFEVNVLTALVLGGMPLSGGSGAKMKAGVIGALMLAIIQNGMILWGVNDKWQEAVQGIILICAVAISYDRKNVNVIS